MKKIKNGFTLLELLIVVLIIGILAGIAVPQYKKAVLKSRLASMFPYVKAVKDAQERYYLINGSYANTLTKLDVNLTCPRDWICDITNNMVEVRPKSTNGLLTIIGRYDLSTVYPSKIYCWASRYASASLKDICKSYGPLLNDNPSEGISYLIQ